jgi:hypothetical protein
MDATNDAIRDYYLLPGIDMTWECLRMAEENGIVTLGRKLTVRLVSDGDRPDLPSAGCVQHIGRNK